MPNNIFSRNDEFNRQSYGTTQSVDLQVQKEQPKKSTEQDGFWSAAWKRGKAQLEQGLATTVEELPQQLTAFGAQIAAGGLGMVGAIPLGTAVNLAKASGQVAAQRSDEALGKPWAGATTPVTSAFRRAAEQNMREAGPSQMSSDAYMNTPTSLSEVPGYLGRVGKFAAEKTVESAPALGAGFIAGLVNPNLGRAVAGSLTYAQEYGGIRQAQAEQGITDYSGATTSAVGATALDLLAGATPAVTNVRGMTAAQAARGVAKEAWHVSKEEALTETAQTAIERLGAGQDLLSRDALADYIGSFIAGGAGGAVFGGGAGMIRHKLGSKPQQEDKDATAKYEQSASTTAQGSDIAGGVAADDTLTSGTKAATPKAPDVLPTEVVKGLFNKGNVESALAGTGIAPKYLPILSKQLTDAFQAGDETKLDNILRAQESRASADHASVKSDEDLARNEAIHGAVSQLIGNFREFHTQALQEEDLLTGPSEVARYVIDKNKQVVQQAKEAQLRNQQASEILAAQQQEAALNEQQRVASEQAAREQEMAAAAKKVEGIHRQGILQTVVSDPETRDPVKRFSALLKRNNFDPNVSEEEAKALEAASAKLEQKTAAEAAKSGLSIQEYKDNLPARAMREAENLGMTAEQYTAAKTAADDMGISVAALVQMQQEQQAARQPAQTQAPAKAQAPYFELQAQNELTPADVAAMEKAQAKRERKAERDTAALAQNAERDREQMSFLAEGAPAPEVVEGKKVVTPAKTGIKQRFDVGKKAAEAFDLKERALRAKAEAEAAAAAKKKKPAKRPALPKDKVAEEKQAEAKKPEPKEKKRAAQKRKKPEGRVSERVRADEERKAPEAGRGNRPEQGREKPKAAEEKVKAPDADKIADRIYDYTTELDRAGLIRYARSLHKQGVISKDDINDIERMSKDRDMGVEDIASELSSQVDIALNPKVEAAPKQVTYEDVLKEAESYLAEDGESGLLKPKEYQQLSLLAEQGKISATDLRERMNAIVTSRSERAVLSATGEETLKVAGEGVSRRGFMKGVAATAATTGIAPKALAANVVDKTSQLYKHLTAGNLNAALTHVAQNGATPILRKVASIMRKHGIGGLQVKLFDITADADSMASHLRNSGVSEDTIDRVMAGEILGLVSKKGSDHSLYLFNTPREPISEQTFIHEMVHAYVKSRWYKIAMYAMHSNEELLGAKGLLEEKSLDVIRKFAELWSAVADSMVADFSQDKNGPWYNRQTEAASKPDEMLSYLMEDEKTQYRLKKMFRDDSGAWKYRPDGNGVSAWEKIVNFFRGLFGIPVKDTSAFGELLDAGYAVLEAGEFVSPDFKVAAAVDEVNGESAKLEETVASKNMPKEFSEPANNVAKRFLNATDENLSVYGFTENLIEDAQKLIPSAKKYLTAMRDRMVKKEEMVRHIEGIRTKFVGLGLKRQGVGNGTLNGYLQDTVQAEKWGFQPDWLEADVKVDPELEAKFKALPASEQAIIKETLKTSHDTLKQKIDAVIDAVTNTYEGLMLTAMDEGNEKKLAKLELEQKNALAEYRGLFAARKDIPYVTTRRFGDYMVVAKSSDLHAAQELGDAKLIEEMKGQEDHYFVQRYDTKQEARDARDKIKASGAFEGGTVISGEVDKTYQQFVGNRDMMLAYDRLRKLIQDQTEAIDPSNKVNAKVISNMERLAVDLQLLALRQTSARKSELRKIGVAGGDMDMMRNFVAQGAADAHMISSLMHSKKVDETVESMRKEAFSDFNADPEKARRFYNELMLRHAAGMAYERSEMAEVIKSATSMFMLSLSPSYYLTNLTQPWVLSVPYMAGEHSYAKVTAEMIRSYGDVAKAWKDTGVTDALNLDNVAADVRDVIQELANRGRIDIGVDKEIGEFHSLKEGKLSNAFDKAGTIIRAASQKVESVNRVSTAAAAYRLAKDAGKTHEQAVDYADKVIRLTHGTYDGFNAPRWMRGPVLSTVTQFKKFQLMQLTLLWKMAKESMSKADTKEAKIERAVARRQLWFTMWHTMGLAGLKGMPAMTAVVFLANLIKGAMDDDDEPADIEQDIRDAIGKDYADLLMTGVPSLAGIDISDRVGMGQVASIIPYSDVKFSREGFYTALAGLLGPGAALVGKAGDAANALYKYGDYYGAVGKLLPNGLDDAYMAYREATKGVKSGGDTVIDPADIDWGQTFARGMGVMTVERAERLRTQSHRYDMIGAFKNRSHEITRDYVEAMDAGDTEAKAKARADWKKLQDERKAAGEKVQPLSNLMRAYKTRNTKRKATVKGIQYAPKSEALRQAQEDAASEE